MLAQIKKIFTEKENSFIVTETLVTQKENMLTQKYD